MDAAIGLDVGGTKVAAGIVGREDARILEKRVFPTRPERGGEAVLAEVAAVVQDLVARCRDLKVGLRGIGVAVPELVDLQGQITTEAVIGWKGLRVGGRFGHGVPTVIEADSRAAALGEARYGAGRPYRDFYYVTVGTGIGSAYVRGGRPHAGARGSAGTLATAPLTTLCSSCGAESRSVLEEIASGPALVARYNRLRAGAATRAEEVTAAAARGESAAQDVVRSAARALGSAVGLVVNVLDPEAVVVGGGLGTSGGLFWETLVGSAREHIWSATNRDLAILPAAFGADAGLVGAGAVVFEGASP